MSDFIVEGVDRADGSRTELHSCDSSGDARAWMRRYISTGDAGGWDLVEVYDVRSDPERLFYWERGESDFPGGNGV